MKKVLFPILFLIGLLTGGTVVAKSIIGYDTNNDYKPVIVTAGPYYKGISLYPKCEKTFGASVLSVTQGGTQTSTRPIFGQLLMGNASGTYDLVATSSLAVQATVNTSSLGLLGSDIGGFTSGSLVFASTSGRLTEDNSSLFWDDTLNYLGINTTTPSSSFHLDNGELKVTGIGGGNYGGYPSLTTLETNDAYRWLQVYKNKTWGADNIFGWYITDTGALAFGAYTTSSIHDPIMLWDGPTGRVGIGYGSLPATFNVTGWAGNNPIVNFASSTDVSAFFIGANSKTGINTTTPSSTLEVAGNVGVTGLISLMGANAGLVAPQTNQNITVTTFGTGSFIYKANAGAGLFQIQDTLSLLTASGADFITFQNSSQTNHEVAAMTQYSDDGWHFGVPGSTANEGNRNFIFVDNDYINKDYDHDVASLNPTLFVQSATNPDSDNTEWGSFSYSSTTWRGFYTRVGSGGMLWGSSTTNWAVINSNGFMGVGTTTPPYMLFVTGDISTTGTYRIGDTDYGQYFPLMIDSVGNNGEIWKSDGSGRGTWVATNTLGFSVNETDPIFTASSSEYARKAVANTFTATNTFANLLFNQLYFNQNPTLSPFTAGKMFYDVNHKTISLELGTDTTLQIGQEEWILALNNGSEAIENGSMVYITGASSSLDLPTIAKAKATSYDGAFTVGMVTENNGIAAGTSGFVTVRGIVHDLDTSAWNIGDNLYLSDTTSGTLSNTFPSAGNYKVRIGRVLTLGTTTGTVYIRQIPESRLQDISDVIATSPSTNQCLVFNGTSWTNGACTSISAGQAIDFYLNGVVSTVSTTLLGLERTPITTAEKYESVSVASDTTTTINAYLSTSTLGITNIPAGPWTFSTYASSTGGVGVQQIIYKVFEYKADNTYTELFRAVTGDIVNTIPTLIDTTVVQPAFTIASTSRLYVRYLGSNSGANARNIGFVENGTDRSSHLHTPIATKHSDLAGLDFLLAGHTGFAGLGVQNTFTASNTFANQVGIGTTTFSDLFSVTGNINTTGTYKISGADVGQYFITTAGTNGQVWMSDGTGAGGWVATSTLYGTLGSMAYLSNTGSSSIAEVGTITTGTWNGTDIDISDYTNLTVGTGLDLDGDIINTDFNEFSAATTLLGGDKIILWQDTAGDERNITWTNFMNNITYVDNDFTGLLFATDGKLSTTSAYLSTTTAATLYLSLPESSTSTWNEAYSWGDWALEGFLTSESASSSYLLLTEANTSTWNSTSDTVTAGATNWDTAYSWGDWSTEGFLTTGSASSSYLLLTEARTSTWNLAFGTSTLISGAVNGQFLTASDTAPNGWEWLPTSTLDIIQTESDPVYGAVSSTLAHTDYNNIFTGALNNFLYHLAIPTSSALNTNSSGEIGIDTTSGQLRYSDGTTTNTLMATFDRAYRITSTTIDKNSLTFSIGTTTHGLWNPSMAVELVKLYAKTDVNTTTLQCGDGTNWTEQIYADPSGEADDGSITNGTFTAREDFICKVGSKVGNPNEIIITATFRYTID